MNYIQRWNALVQSAYEDVSLAQVSVVYRAPDAVRDLSHFSEAVVSLTWRAHYPEYYDYQWELEVDLGSDIDRWVKRPDTFGPKVPWIPISATVDHPYTGTEFWGTDWLPFILESAGIDANPDRTQMTEFLAQAQEAWTADYHGQFNTQTQFRQFLLPNLNYQSSVTTRASLHQFESDGVVNIWSQRGWHDYPEAGVPLREQQFFEPLTFHGIGHSKFVVSTRDHVSERETSYRPIGSIIMDRLSKPASPQYWHPWPRVYDSHDYRYR